MSSGTAVSFGVDIGGRAPLRILVVCTANVCRSPVAERLLSRHLGLAGHQALVASAGVLGGELEMHPYTIEAARLGGIDLTDHVSRRLTADLLAVEGADLVIAMAREQLVQAVALDPSIWPRTFTLKQLARAALVTPLADVDGDWTRWLQRIGSGRHTDAFLIPDPADDVADPYGSPIAAHLMMMAEINLLCEQIAGR